LLELNLFASYPRQPFVNVGLNGDPMSPQLVTDDGQSFLDDIVDIERSPGPCTRLEMHPDIFDHGVRTVSGGHDAPKCIPGTIEVRLDTIKPAQSRVGTGYDRR